MTADRARLERLLGGPALAGLRSRLRRRYERDAGPDAFTLAPLADPERAALEGLLGRRTRRAASMRLSLAELDAAIAHAGVAPGLRAALEALDGPIRDLARERRALGRRWDLVFAGERPAPLRALLGDAAGRGLVKRAAGGDPDRALDHLERAARVLDRLPAAGVPRSRLAAEGLGDAHALDDGRPVATIVLAVLARTITEEDGDPERRRDLWARSGVLVNELAAPVLALGLPAGQESPAGRLAAVARAAGEPVHLSLRALLRAPTRWAVRAHAIFVCENPTVVAVAADRLGAGCAPLVCTDGMPGAAQRTLLAQLAESGASLRYHGDFDWPGVRIGNFVMRRFGAQPWRFRAADYEPGAGRALEGTPADAQWDPALAPKMAGRGLALDEEAVVETLVGDLAG